MQLHIHLHHSGEIHIHHHGDDKLFTEIKSINQKLSTMGQELQTLQQEVAENNTVMQSAITLLQGLKQRLDDAATDPAALKQLSDELDANTNALAAAVAANTPAQNETGTGGETPGANL
jgi:chromosome segregation ATPase